MGEKLAGVVKEKRQIIATFGGCPNLQVGGRNEKD